MRKRKNKKIDIKRKKNKFKTAYDLKCISLLSYKIILAHIMKRTLKEYKHEEIHTIYNCIEKNHSTGKKILGLKQDFKYLNYDLFFTSALVNSDESIGLLINLEPQKTSKNLDYNIFNRALFYACNAIVYQYNKIFKNSKYDKIRKVYSIFICFDAPTTIEENSMTTFHLSKNINIGYNKYEDYDKLSMIVIYLGVESNENDLLRFIELLFTSELNTNEIITALNNEYNIQTDEIFEKEVQEMCNLSERIEERGIKKGYTKGIEKGIEKGKILFAVEQLKKRMSKKNMSLMEAIEDLDYDTNNYSLYKTYILDNQIL